MLALYDMTKNIDNPPPIGLLDLDGTVADYDGEMNKFLATLASPEEPPYVAQSRDNEPPHIQARRNLIKKLPGFWRNLPKLELGFHVVDEMLRLGFALNVLTKGPGSVPTAFGEKVEWCQKNLPKMPLSLSDDKSLVYGRVLADDWPDFFLPWLKYRPRGLVVAVAQPWNVGIDHPQVLRYDGTNREALRAALKVAANAERR